VPRIPQAGAIVFRSERGEARVLLVRAKSAPHPWIFPKGHLERGESMAAAALREASEETGIDGVVVGLAGLPLAFRSKGEDVSVEYYLVRLTREAPSPEGREKRWCTIPDALALLEHQDARKLLENARGEIEWRTAWPTGSSPTRTSPPS
jgi:ADP-ribose pyrophosphatase YjhB (NUDIX family)